MCKYSQILNLDVYTFYSHCLHKINSFDSAKADSSCPTLALTLAQAEFIGSPIMEKMLH